MIYSVLAMTALMMIGSLAVDLGRVQLAKSELQTAVDSAARAALPYLPNDTAGGRSAAIALAAMHKVDGQPLTLLNADVEFGTWANGTFTSGGSPSTVVRVTGYRTTSRGSGIPLLLARSMGLATFDIQVTAVLGVTAATSSYGVVGLNSVSMDSNARVDSYNSSLGNYSDSWSPDAGNVASNGSMQLDSNAIIRGDGRRYGGTPSLNSNAQITGSKAALSSQLSYANASNDGYGTSNNDNNNISASYRSGNHFSATSSSNTVAMPAGNYYFQHFTLKDATLNVTGPATVYVTGHLKIEGDAKTSVHVPGNLRFRVIGNGHVRLEGNSYAYADIYAPQSDLEMDSNARLYGRVIAKTVEMKSNTMIHVDEALTGGSSGGGTISLHK